MGLGDPIYFSISFSLVYSRLNTENQLSKLPGSALKACLVGGGGGGRLRSEFSDRFGYSLALAKTNNTYI